MYAKGGKQGVVHTREAGNSIDCEFVKNVPSQWHMGRGQKRKGMKEEEEREKAVHRLWGGGGGGGEGGRGKGEGGPLAGGGHLQADISGRELGCKRHEHIGAGESGRDQGLTEAARQRASVGPVADNQHLNRAAPGRELWKEKGHRAVIRDVI